MYKGGIIFLALLCSIASGGQELYKTTSGEVSFFSSAPIEDIKAVSDQGVSVLDLADGQISFLVNIRSLDFPKDKMEEHFNENFMESHRYPNATFKGEIVGNPELSEGSPQKVSLRGILDIHGKKSERTLPAMLLLKDGKIYLESRFEVACKDHSIEIPRILWQNIAEVVEVSVNAKYDPIK